MNGCPRQHREAEPGDPPLIFNAELTCSVDATLSKDNGFHPINTSVIADVLVADALRTAVGAVEVEGLILADPEGAVVVGIAAVSLDDADVSWAKLGHLILLRIKPFREEDYRYLVYDTRARRVTRIDAIGLACHELPEDHGIIFPGGYYLQSGDHKLFDGVKLPGRGL